MEEDYISAKAILQSRIENSDDEIDQLLAGINLDNVELLETLTENESKAPLNLKIKQAKIMTIDRQKQEKFDRLNKLLKGLSDSDVPAVENILSINNYPNPFNPTTTIMFNLPKDSKVEIDIYNIKGQKVKSLISDDFIAGKHKLIWNGTNNFNKKVSSGIYFYRLKTNQGIINKKMLLLK